jgi:hypothetical protein
MIGCNTYQMCPPLRQLLLLIPLALLLTGSTRAQSDDSPSAGLERSIESSVEQSDGTDGGVLEELEEYRRRRIDLTTATADDLTRLPLISLQDAIAILDFVDRVHPGSMHELEVLPRLDAEQLLVLRTCTTIRHAGEARRAEDLDISIRSRFVQDLQQRRGFTDTLHRILPRRGIRGDSLGLDTISLGPTYTGSPAGVLQRLLASYDAYSCGIVFEKDPGEPFFYSDTLDYSYRENEYVDAPAQHVAKRFGSFLSGYAAASFEPASIVLGDYSAEFGQGLTLWSGFGGFKGGDVTKAPFKSGRGIAGRASSGETFFFRGAALTLHDGFWLPKGFTASLFASYRTLDATIATSAGSDGESNTEATSLREDGYRRTRSEIRRSGDFDERLWGVNIRKGFDAGHIGTTAYASWYGVPVRGAMFYDFTGDRSTMISVDGKYRINRTSLFGEIARSTDGTIGATGGAATRVGRIDLTLAGRYIPASFYTPHGEGFGESPQGQHNEEGFYLGMKAAILPRMTLSAYFDLFRRPEATALIPFPTDGSEEYLRLDYAPSQAFTAYAQLRRERRGDPFTSTDTAAREHTLMLDRLSTEVRLEAECSSPGDRVCLRGRLERRWIDYSRVAPSTAGFLTFIDLRYRPVQSVSISARLTLFATDRGDASLVEFEQDLPGRISLASLAGEGRRFYLYARWQPTGSTALTARYAETVYADREVIGPGTPQQISGAVGSTLSLQVDLAF